MTPSEALECFKTGTGGGEAVKAAIEALETVSKYQWVSVKDRLPEEGEAVFVIISGLYGETLFINAIEPAEYYPGCDTWILTEHSRFTDPRPKYWMPICLPPLPEEVKE